MAGTGIVLVNLGSPDSTEVKDVKKYLAEFLMDEKVIDMPYLLRLFLVRGIIVPFRAPKSAAAYKSIWTKDGSPLIVLSQQLQTAVQAKTDIPVELAMRYGNPSPKAAFDNLLKKNPSIDHVIIFPLYPHYAMSSYETAVEYMYTEHKKHGYSFKLSTVPPYYNDDAYISALANSIQPYLQQEFDKLLFSYHGVPERHIYKGDITGNHCLKSADCCNTPSEAHKQCYRHQTFVTTALATKALGLEKNKVEQTFQSRLGRDPWLQPYTAERLQQLPGEGVKKLLVACPAFVSDCLETLEEIAEEGKEIFLHAGGESFTMIPCLNVHPMWVGAIMQYLQRCGA